MEIQLLPFLLLVLSSVVAADNGLDNKLLENFLDEVYKKKDSSSQVFMNMIWPKVMPKLIPESVLIPAEEDETVDNRYGCATETKIYPKLKNIARPLLGKLTGGRFGRGWTSETIENRIVVKFDVDLEFTKSLAFELAEKKQDGTVVETTPVSYSFKGGNRVGVVLSIPDFAQVERSAVTSQCLVYVHNVFVRRLSEPVLDKKVVKEKQAREMATAYQEVMRIDYHNLFTTGVIRAVINNLEDNSWMCAHEKLKAKDKDKQVEWEYSPNYKEYCKDKRCT